MNTLDMGVVAGAAVAGLAVLLWLRHLLKRGLRRKAGGPNEAPPLVERRMTAMERAQAEIVGRLDEMAAAGAPEERLQAMAASLVGLIKDKNGTMETALAGLDQLRARLKVLEQIGDMAEARALFDGLSSRLDGLDAGLKAAGAETRAQVAALQERLDGDGGPVAVLGAQLSRLHEQKDAGLAAALARLAPLEARLGRIEGDLKALPQGAFEKVDDRLAALGRLQSEIGTELAALKARAEAGAGPYAEIADQLTRLYAQKDATTEAMLARLGPLEAKLAEIEAALAGQDPRAALDRFAERLAAAEAAHATAEARLGGEIDTLKAAENPFAEIADQLTRLYAQKDATTEAMLARLGPLEEKLGQIEGALPRLATLEATVAGQDPRAALDRFAERLAAAEAAQAATEARLGGEIDTLKAAESPFTEIADQLTRLYAQKDATTEAMLARLTPLEARLAEIEAALAGQDPRAALDRFAERLAAAETAHAATEARLGSEIDALKAAESPFAEVSDQLTRLYAQKDAGIEAMLARLGPLEAKLAEIEVALAGQDPHAALDRFAERLAAAETAHAATEARLGSEIDTLKAAESPFAEVSDQLTRLYAQKDATTEAMLTRLGPLETKLAAVETALGAQDPRAALDRFAERLAAAEAAHAATETRLAGEIDTLKAAENPFTEIAGQLTRLYAQKDAVAEAVLARLAPVEGKLAEIEAALGAQDPRAALDRFAERLAAAETAHGRAEARLAGEIDALKADSPFAEISDQITRLMAEKDASAGELRARLEPIEEKLAALEGDLAARDPQAAVAGLAARIERLGGDQDDLAARLAAIGETAGSDGEIAALIADLAEQKDALAAEVSGRIGPLEARLAAIEAQGTDAEDAARAEAGAIAEQLVAMRAAAEQTTLFADRIALIEASLPRLNFAQSLMMEALERRAADEGRPPVPAAAPDKAETAAETAAEPETGEIEAADIEDVWNLPRVVSMHQA